MKSIIFPAIIGIIAAMIISCSDSTGPNDAHQFPGPVDRVATDIQLFVYSDGWGTILDTIDVAEEGSVTIDIEEENPYYDPPQYYIYAKADDFYTELYYCSKGEAIDVDLDSVPDVENSITGVIFAQQTYFADCYFPEQAVALSVPGGESFSSSTDAQGRFGFSALEEITYILHLQEYGMPHTFELSNSSETNYYDLAFLEYAQVEAPNLYLYPENTMAVSVELDIAGDGYITESQPPYGDGWNVMATPEGIINDIYDYLFYEVKIPVPVNHDTGWLLDGTDLESELSGVLNKYGFDGREMDDFMEYWLPRLESAPWFALYPQNADSMVILDISPPPDNILRAIFLIRPLPKPVSIPLPPDPPAFTRTGFTAVEWGMIYK